MLLLTSMNSPWACEGVTGWKLVKLVTLLAVQNNVTVFNCPYREKKKVVLMFKLNFLYLLWPNPVQSLNKSYGYNIKNILTIFPPSPIFPAFVYGTDFK